MINSFFFNYNLRMIQEYFQAKIGRKIRIFSQARKHNIKTRVYVKNALKQPSPILSYLYDIPLLLS